MGKIVWLPLGSRLILRRVNEYAGNLVLPPSAKQGSMMCEVVCTGEECTHDYVTGTKLLIGRYSGYDVPVLAREYNDCVIVNEEDILCYTENSNESEGTEDSAA